MGYRTFRDSHGTEWQAWDVVPQLGERRRTERRGRVSLPIANDRRMRADRRVGTAARSVLTSELGAGWLCFEAPDEKRRLTPIPLDWQQCPTAQLERYCECATVARRPTSSFQTHDRHN